MKFKYFLIISIILLSTFALGCINKIEPSSDSKVVLDKNHPSQTYFVTVDDDSSGNIEVSIDDVFQTNIPIVKGNYTYSWTIYGNNITKGEHKIKFRADDDTSYSRYVTNNIGNDIETTLTNTNNSTDNQPIIAYNTLFPGLIYLAILIIILTIVKIIFRGIKELRKKGSVFKDLVLTCPNCRDRDIYHDFKKDDLIDVYRCNLCGTPRIIETKLTNEKIKDEPYDKMVEFSDEKEK